MTGPSDPRNDEGQSADKADNGLAGFSTSAAGLSTTCDRSRLTVDLLNAEDGLPVEGGEAFINFQQSGSGQGVFALPAGDYRLRVSSTETARVEYTLEVVFLLQEECLEALNCGEPISERPLPAGEQDVFAVNVESGQSISLDWGGSVMLDLFRSDGTRIALQGGLPKMEVLGLAAGSYLLRITGTSNGTYDVTLTCNVESDFIRGDADSNGRAELTDAVVILRYLFVEGAKEPACFDAADVNDSGELESDREALELTDAVILLRHLFGADPMETPPDSPAPREPEPPFPECGPDSTEDRLDCAVGSC